MVQDHMCMGDILAKLRGWDKQKKERDTSMTWLNVNLTDAHKAFVSFISAANQQKTSPELLDDVYQEKIDRLDQNWRVLDALAGEGMEEQLTPLLNTLLQEWAIKEAVEILLRYQGCFIDPSYKGLQQAFWEKLSRQAQTLSSELLLQMQRGKEQRARAQEERAQSWQSTASRLFEDQCRQNQQWLQYQQQMFGHYQQANREWAEVAMVGVQHAQVGMKQWYDFAANTQANVAHMLAGTEQRQVAVVEQALQKANMKKWGVRLAIAALVLVGILALWGFAFFASMRLY